VVEVSEKKNFETLNSNFFKDIFYAQSCSTKMDEIDEELFEVHDSCCQNDSETSSTLLDNVNAFQFTKSTKEPVIVKASTKKQAEEEFKLLKNLAVSIGERKAKKAKLARESLVVMWSMRYLNLTQPLAFLPNMKSLIFCSKLKLENLGRSTVSERSHLRQLYNHNNGPFSQYLDQILFPDRQQSLSRQTIISSARIVNHAVVYHL
jgi:hypothetical protein